jgi:hypothetical protein
MENEVLGDMLGKISSPSPLAATYGDSQTWPFA